MHLNFMFIRLTSAFRKTDKPHWWELVRQRISDKACSNADEVSEEFSVCTRYVQLKWIRMKAYSRATCYCNFKKQFSIRIHDYCENGHGTVTLTEWQT